MNSNNKGRKLLQILVIAAFAVYNYSSLISINSITDRLSYIESKIALAKFQSSKIPDLLATNKKNINYAESITSNFENDVEYLESSIMIKSP